jgi:hypothetical protein
MDATAIGRTSLSERTILAGRTGTDFKGKFRPIVESSISATIDDNCPPNALPFWPDSPLDKRCQSEK